MQADGPPGALCCGPGPGDLMSEAVFHMCADPASVRDGLRRAFAARPLSALTGEDRGIAEIVLSEVLNNVIEHAYAQGGGPILLAVSPGPGRLQCRVEDEGAAMPGGGLPAGPPPDPADLPEGGFGWHLIRCLCQSLRYERAGRVNRLHFSLSAEDPGAGCGLFHLRAK